MEFKNVHKFEQWLQDNLKAEIFDIHACLSDVVDQLDSTGMASYELKGYETKSGHAEVYRYEVERKYFIDDVEVEHSEEFDDVATVVIF